MKDNKSCWQFPKALEIIKCKEGNKEFMKERPARRPFGNTVLICEYPIDDTAAVVRVFADEKPETDDTPEEKRLFTEAPMQCPFCEGENSNARVYEDKQNKEYFVYCPKCGIETKDTFTSKAKAVKAFTEGKTKKITGSEVADE